MISYIIFVYSSSIVLYLEIPDTMYSQIPAPALKACSVTARVLRHWCAALTERHGVEGGRYTGPKPPEVSVRPVFTHLALSGTW